MSDMIGKKIAWEGLGRYAAPVAGEVTSVAGNKLVVKQHDGKVGFVPMDHHVRIEFLDDHSNPKDWHNWELNILRRDSPEFDKFMKNKGE